MPREIKIVVVLLLLSSAIPFLVTYLDSLEYLDNDNYSTLLNTVDIFWLCIVLWIVWGIKNHANHRFTTMAVGLVILGFLIWDYIDFGFSISQPFSLLEAIIFFISWYILGKEKSRNWCAK